MPGRETSKQRSGRIAADYYKQPDRLARGKAWLSAVVIVITVLWLSGLLGRVGDGLRRSERVRVLASHGPLARVHAAWDTECEACHAPFQPIDGSSWAARLAGTGRSTDSRCEACHAGPAHHQSASDPTSCSSCHRDHGGRDASLVKIDDHNCTRCHANLDNHLKPGAKTAFATSITRFTGGTPPHPEFKPLTTKDPGRLIFDHALHLAKGFNLEPDGRPLKTLADLGDSDRPYYRTDGKSDGEGIQLRCDACHQLEPARASRLANGQYMQPIRYDTHCQACHVLEYDPTMPPMRHGLQLDAVKETLWQSYAAGYIQGHPELKDWRPQRELPWREVRPELRAAYQAIEAKVAKAEQILYAEKRCGECHLFETREGKSIEIFLKMDPKTPARVSSPNVPVVWFSHATFDHSAHRAVQCESCHSQAKGSRKSSDIMIPGITVCQGCHAPRSHDGALASGGAGFGCTECHRYHNGDAPLHGKGARSRDDPNKSSIQELLLGIPHAGRH
jgi:hypothetical protein